MRSLAGIRIGLTTTLLLAGLSGLLANPALNPKRTVAEHVVDLNPLFKWWTNHAGPRPLTAWVHITGSVVATNAVGWVLEATVERAARDQDTAGAPADAARATGKVVLHSPPLQDLVEFQNLSAQLATLNAQRSALTNEETLARSREQTVAGEQRNLPHNSLRWRALARQDNQLKQLDAEAKAQLKPLDQQIQQIKAKLAPFPKPDHYVVDCFALDLQREYDRMPVYDHGFAFK